MGEVLTAVVHAGEDWFRTRETKKEQRWQRRVSTALYPLPEQELLSQYAEAFTNLARLFETLPCQKERPGDEALSKVVVQVRQDICARCKNEEQDMLLSVIKDSTKAFKVKSRNYTSSGLDLVIEFSTKDIEMVAQKIKECAIEKFSIIEYDNEDVV